MPAEATTRAGPCAMSVYLVRGSFNGPLDGKRRRFPEAAIPSSPRSAVDASSPAAAVRGWWSGSTVGVIVVGSWRAQNSARRGRLLAQESRLVRSVRDARSALATPASHSPYGLASVPVKTVDTVDTPVGGRTDAEVDR